MAILALLIMQFISPPERKKEIAIRVRILSAEPVRPPRPPRVTVRQTPVPEQKTDIKKINDPRKPPKKIPKKTKRTPKEKTNDITKVIQHTPRPTATPEPTATVTPIPTPTATPWPTRTPVPVTVRPTPIPAATPPPRIRPNIIPPRAPASSASPFAQTPGAPALSQSYTSKVVWLIGNNFEPTYAQPGRQTVVAFRIQRDGTIMNARIHKSSGRTDLDQFALVALSKTRLPAFNDGYPAQFADVTLTFEFDRN